MPEIVTLHSGAHQSWEFHMPFWFVSLTSPGQITDAARQESYFVDILVCVVIIRIAEYEGLFPQRARNSRS